MTKDLDLHRVTIEGHDRIRQTLALAGFDLAASAQQQQRDTCKYLEEALWHPLPGSTHGLIMPGRGVPVSSTLVPHVSRLWLRWQDLQQRAYSRHHAQLSAAALLDFSGSGGRTGIPALRL